MTDEPGHDLVRPDVEPDPVAVLDLAGRAGEDVEAGVEARGRDERALGRRRPGRAAGPPWPTSWRLRAVRLPMPEASALDLWTWTPRTRVFEAFGVDLDPVAGSDRAGEDRAGDDRAEAVHGEDAVDGHAEDAAVGARVGRGGRSPGARP